MKDMFRAIGAHFIVYARSTTAESPELDPAVVTLFDTRQVSSNFRITSKPEDNSVNSIYLTVKIRK